jgi:hypothetical protein
VVFNPDDPVLEIISVKIGKNVGRSYKGFGGTFVSLVDCCTRKKALPGLYEEGLITGAELKEKVLLLSLSEQRLEDEISDIMDIALRNLGAFPSSEGKAGFFVEVNYDNP